MLQMLVTTYAFVVVNWWPDLGSGNSRTRALCVVPLEKCVFFFFTDITLLDAELLHGCFYHSIVSEMVRALVAWVCHFLVFSNRLGLGFDIELHSVAGLWECLWQSTLE